MRAKGTIEYYRNIFMTHGLQEMIQSITEIMKEAGNPITPTRLDNFIKAILYGANKDGTIRNTPLEPDMNDIVKDYSKFQFEKEVYRLWVNGRNPQKKER